MITAPKLDVPSLQAVIAWVQDHNYNMMQIYKNNPLDVTHRYNASCGKSIEKYLRDHQSYLRGLTA